MVDISRHLDLPLEIHWNDKKQIMILQKRFQLGKQYEDLSSEVIGITEHDAFQIMEAIKERYPHLHA